MSWCGFTLPSQMLKIVRNCSQNSVQCRTRVWVHINFHIFCIGVDHREMSPTYVQLSYTMKNWCHPECFSRFGGLIPWRHSTSCKVCRRCRESITWRVDSEEKGWIRLIIYIQAPVACPLVIRPAIVTSMWRFRRVTQRPYSGSKLESKLTLRSKFLPQSLHICHQADTDTNWRYSGIEYRWKDRKFPTPFL